jgi:hypothetical protein
MQTVSENWKNAHKRIMLDESFVEVSLDIADPDALANASSQDNGAIYISNSSELTSRVEKNPIPYCTLEQNLWCLDGNRKALPDSDFGDNCYIGDVLSDDTCDFRDKLPMITISFPKVFSKLIPGVTIVWSNTYEEFADTFVVIAYNGDTIVAEKEVVVNRSVKSLVFVDIIEYDRITIFIKKWCLPHHRARIEEILVGLNKVYGKADLFDYSHSKSVDPVSTALPKDEIKYSVDNVEGEYNPYNPEGLAKYLIERQEIKVRYGLRLEGNAIEWIKGGTFYLSEWYAKQNGMTADFTARDLLEFMSAIYYDPITQVTERSLYDLATTLLQRAELPVNSDGSVKWVIDESLKSIYTKAPLPEDTLANCLQLIANAGECVLYQDREGTLRIEPLKFDDTDYSINSFNSYSKSEITLSKPLKQVDVNVYSYTKSDKGFDSTKTDVPFVVGIAGETITVDNPLVTDVNRALSLATWMATHLGHRMTLDSSWRVDVRLDALDIVANENAYHTNRVRMTDIEFKYNGAFRGTGKGKVI